MPRSTSVRRTTVAALSALAAATAGLVLAPPAAAASSTVVISEVYGGGGNSSATLTNDFVELRNLGATPVSIDGWSVQYASASGTSWQVTPLSGSIPAGGRYLVQEAAGTGGTTALPTADAIGTIPMSGTAGKVALATSTTACDTTCATTAVDFVGYGTATTYEGSGPAPAPSNTASTARTGTTDTDDNAADFAAGAPTPTNAAGETTGGGGPVDPPPTGTSAAIHDVQGPGRLSALAGQVVETTGVVTAVAARSYWVQDPQPDADPNTSEGLLVFANAAPAVAVGDSVRVVGTVTEYRSSSAPKDLRVTELTTPTSVVLSSGNAVPAPTLIGPGGLVPPAKTIFAGVSTDVETAGGFDPATNGIDFYEALEGMRVQINDAQVVGPTSSFGELPVVPVGSGPRTARGGIIASADDYNPERILLDDVVTGPTPAANVGDTIPGPVVGVLDYSFSNIKLNYTSVPTIAAGNLPPEVTAPAGAKQLAVATFNVENLSPADSPAKFDRLAKIVVTSLAAPDVVALEEVQDNTGPTNDGVVDADQTLQKLVAAIQAAGGPTYQWRQINPTDRQDGGQPGGNIRVAFLFRTDRGLSFVDKAGAGDPTATAVGVTGYGKGTHLTASPGRIDPTSTAWESSRKPLVGEFLWRGKTVYVVANHFNSKGGDDPLFGAVQPPVQSSQTQRLEQAKAVAGFVDSVYQRNPLANVVVVGDLNDFEYSTPVTTLTGKYRLIDLIKTLPKAERYTYVYQGNSQALDHILISPALLLNFGFSGGKLIPPFTYDVVHVNSEYADQVSDHDPQVVKIFN